MMSSQRMNARQRTSYDRIDWSQVMQVREKYKISISSSGLYYQFANLSHPC